MGNTFFISDTHFGHKNVILFKDEDGKLMRPGFANIDEMNEHIIECWNKTVTNKDKVIHCGDVAFGSAALELCKRLNGIKYLVLGNHDNLDIYKYAGIFKKIYGVKYMSNDVAICTHAPIHETSLRKFKLNIHGHLHDEVVGDKRYFNVSVEQLNYTPIELEEILLRVARHRERWPDTPLLESVKLLNSG